MGGERTEFVIYHHFYFSATHPCDIISCSQHYVFGGSVKRLIETSLAL